METLLLALILVRKASKLTEEQRKQIKSFGLFHVDTTVISEPDCSIRSVNESVCQQIHPIVKTDSVDGFSLFDIAQKIQCSELDSDQNLTFYNIFVWSVFHNLPKISDELISNSANAKKFKEKFDDDHSYFTPEQTVAVELSINYALGHFSMGQTEMIKMLIEKIPIVALIRIATFDQMLVMMSKDLFNVWISAHRFIPDSFVIGCLERKNTLILAWMFSKQAKFISFNNIESLLKQEKYTNLKQTFNNVRQMSRYK